MAQLSLWRALGSHAIARAFQIGWILWTHMRGVVPRFSMEPFGSGVVPCSSYSFAQTPPATPSTFTPTPVPFPPLSLISSFSLFCPLSVFAFLGSFLCLLRGPPSLHAAFFVVSPARR